MNSTFPILFIGNAQRQEFREAALWLRDRGAQMAVDIPAALDVLYQENFSPAVIVLAQFGPRRFTEGQLGTLRQAAPLARIVRLLGPWLEGENRTGQPLPATLRAYWHQWLGHLQRPMKQADSDELSKWLGSYSTWSLPVTVGDDERLLAAYEVDGPAPSLLNPIAVQNQEVISIPLVAVWARHRESAQSLCDIFTQRGWKSLWLRTLPMETPLLVDAVLFDLRFGTASELSNLAALKAVTNGAPLIALLGFPRLEDISRLQAAGAASVVSKPFLAGDLLWQIEQLLPAASSA